MDVQRTPDERFVDLADWPYQPSYATVTASDIDIPLRLAYVDVGPETGRSVLLIHGEPTWGYLYRKMIPGLVEAGCRVVVPDLIGFGRSDKPAQKSDYTYARHIDWVSSLVEQLDLQDTVLFGQDWGSLIGMAVVARYPERFAAVMIGNGGLPDPEHREQMMTAQQTSPDPGAFLRWQQHAAQLDSMNVSETLRRGLADIPGAAIKLTNAEAAAYDAPFPDRTYQAGPLIFPHWRRPMATKARLSLSLLRHGECLRRGKSRSCAASERSTPFWATSTTTSSSASRAAPASLTNVSRPEATSSKSRNQMPSWTESCTLFTKPTLVEHGWARLSASRSTVASYAALSAQAAWTTGWDGGVDAASQSRRHRSLVLPFSLSIRCSCHTKQWRDSTTLGRGARRVPSECLCATRAVERVWRQAGRLSALLGYSSSSATSTSARRFARVSSRLAEYNG